MSKRGFIPRRRWYNPRFRWFYWREKRSLNRCTERPCSEGNCAELVTPTGEVIAGWGPVGCPCGKEAEQ